MKTMNPLTMTNQIPYESLLENSRWQQKRAEIIRRDGNRCRNCGSDNILQVHHRQYHIDSITGRKYLPWEYADENLITFCKSCHELGHKLYKVPVFVVER